MQMPRHLQCSRSRWLASGVQPLPMYSHPPLGLLYMSVTQSFLLSQGGGTPPQTPYLVPKIRANLLF